MVAKAMQNLLKANRVRDEYTFTEREVERELDRTGKVKATHTTVK